MLLPVPVDHAWALAVWPILWILPGLSAALLLLLRALDSAGIVCCTAAAGTCCSGADPAVSAGFGCTAAAGTCCCGADPAVSPRFGCTAAGGTCCCVAVSVDCAGFVACCTASAVAITCGSSSADSVGFASESMAMGSGAGGCTSGFKGFMGTIILLYINQLFLHIDCVFEALALGSEFPRLFEFGLRG